MKYFLYPALAILFLTCTVTNRQPAAEDTPIDREALVRRHNVVLSAPDSMNALSVGNGEFAFTADVSGLQTFPDYYENGLNLGTQAQWGWHTIPTKEYYTLADVAKSYTSCNDKQVPYPVQNSGGRAGEATNWLRANPHRLHLGLVGLILLKADGSEAAITDLQNIEQQLDMWTGKLDTRYTLEGVPVHVELYSHQDQDMIATRITSPLVAQGRLQLRFRFPYGKECHVCPGYDWERPERHRTVATSVSDRGVVLRRSLDATTYYTTIAWSGGGSLTGKQAHEFTLSPAPGGETLAVSVAFSQTAPTEQLADFAATEANSTAGWQDFWTSGAAVDFSACTDPRARELERRVVLSQYLTRIQCAGSLPPQETGLTFNSWYGKFHLEMHWWHGVHFALWDRLPLLERSLAWYDEAMAKAQATARRQGYLGARWQKMTEPGGAESPSSVGAFIIWQQPHPIYFAELVYRQKPNEETLNRYRAIVFQTAEFMASFVQFNKADGHYHLCPPIIPAQELFKATTTYDPPLELAYWRFALTVAQQWRKRLGLPRDETWQHVLDHLAPLPVKDGLYLPDAASPAAYEVDEYRRDHPAVVGAYGMLPGNGMVDTAMMAQTFANIMNDWNWETTWGWDYPLLAMTAARLGRPEQAVKALLLDVQKNTYLRNGHNYQDQRLRIYLPGNGGLLTAVAMMAAGWDGAPERPNPGFPADGTWRVKWEGLHKMP